MKIIKRNKTEVSFDVSKIVNAITKANNEVVAADRLGSETVSKIASDVAAKCEALGRAVSVEEVQDMVEEGIVKAGSYAVAKAYITYRFTRQLQRQANTTDDSILSLVAHENEELKQENANKNPMIASTQRDYIAGEVSKDLTNRVLLQDREIVEAHEAGIIHFHDSDYFLQTIHNCDLWNLEDMLQNGTVISGVTIDKPHSFATACNIATQIVAQVASSQYGGQTFSLAHLAPFVDVSRTKWTEKIRKDSEDAGLDLTDEQLSKLVESRLREEVKSGVQTIQYQLVTLMTTNGQTPFVSVHMYLDEVPEGQIRDDLAMIIEEVLIQRKRGLKNEKGQWVVAAFPKLLYVLDEDNIYKDSKYYYLTRLAAECTAKTMVPDYISAKVMKELKGDVYPCMGCRSFLTPDRFTDKGIGNIAKAKNYVEGQHKYYGRFNQGVVTINLVDVACSSYGDMGAFWQILDERLELCHRALQKRHKRLKGTLSDVAPILWQHGALARLEKGEVIDPLLYNGYSTISLGYAGVYEMTYYMTGESHTSENGKEFALAVMQHLNDKCAEWREAENIDYSLYGTPIESTTYKFAKCLQKRFGIIPEVTDHNYITNSYHISVREPIDAFEKLTKEAEFQRLSPGGAISYVEVPNMQNNIEAVMAVLTHIYNTIMYAELNTKSDYCQVCGYDGEIKIEKVDGKYIWKCPQCGNEDQSKMNVARRTCGYIGTNFWNQGRTQEIAERVLHL